MTVWVVPWVAAALVLAGWGERRGFSWWAALAGGLLVGPLFAVVIAASDPECQ